MENRFPNTPGMVFSINDGNLRIERAVPGQKITILGVTTADLPINEPILLSDASSGRTSLFHPATGTFSAKPSELNALMAEVAKGVAVEFVKIAHGWGDEGFLYINEPDFDGHILTEQERYVALQETFDVLLNHNMDAVYCGGIYIDSKPALDEIMGADGETPVYGSTDGDFAYQLADFCNTSSEENQTVLSAIGRMPIRIKQFRESVKAAYYDKLHIDQFDTLTIGTMLSSSSSSSEVVASKTVVIDISSTPFGDNLPFHGSSITIHYPTGSKTYTVDSFDGIDTITLLEYPTESDVPLKVSLQTFDTSDGPYDSSLTEMLQTQFRLAFRGYHPTDTSSSNRPTLYEFTKFYQDAIDFVGNTNVDGYHASGGNLLPDDYRMFGAVGGAPANPDGSTGDILDGNGQKVDLGKWISLGALEGFSSNSFGDQTLRLIGFASENKYVSTGMGEYIALVLKLRANVSTTNKPLEGFITNRDMNRTMADLVIACRYIFTKRRANSGFAIAAGDTGAYNIDENRRSDFVRLTTIRIVGAILKSSRAIVDPYIGGPASTITIASMRSELNEMYELFVRDEFIREDFDFQLTQNSDQAILGHVYLNQTVTPSFEVRKVFGDMNLKR